MLSKKEKQQTASGVNNRILEDASFQGDMTSKSDFRIDGTLIGNVNIEGRLVVGRSAYIQGDIHCVNADVEGRIQGNIFVKEMLSLRKSAQITGKIVIHKLLVEPGAVLNVECKMENNV